jgi:hypothetical protein
MKGARIGTFDNRPALFSDRGLVCTFEAGAQCVRKADAALVLRAVQAQTPPKTDNDLPQDLRVLAESDGFHFLDDAATEIDGLRVSKADLVKALESLLNVLTDRNAPGCNVDGRWMGVPDWGTVDKAAAALARARGEA